MPNVFGPTADLNGTSILSESADRERLSGSKESISPVIMGVNYINPSRFPVSPRTNCERVAPLDIRDSWLFSAINI